MLRFPLFLLLLVIALAGCSTIAPLYEPLKPAAPSGPPGAEGYSVTISVVPRIGLFDELLYNCKQDYTERIAGQLIDTVQILPKQWDAIIPLSAYRTKSLAECKDTHVKDLSRRRLTMELKHNGQAVRDGCDWDLAGNLFYPAKAVTSACTFDGVVSSNDAVPFKVRVDGQVISGEVPRDFLLVSMGDSFAAGEGSPDVAIKTLDGSPDPSSVTWMSQRCHRSLWAAPIRAGIDLARQWHPDKLADVYTQGAYTIISSACSGAELRDLTTPGYPGRETLAQLRLARKRQDYPNLPLWGIWSASLAPERKLDAQVDQIAAILDSYRKDGRRPVIDALVLSVGGNDINFGLLVTDLVARRDILDEQQVGEGVERDIKALKSDFGTLAAQLKEKFAVDRVFVTGYPNPTVITANSAPKTENATTEYCDCNRQGFLGLGVIETALLCMTRHENEVASTKLIQPLNRELETVAARYGWELIPDIETALIGNAWCQDATGEHARYFRTFADSYGLQGALPGTLALSTGAMHPSANGHEKAYQGRLLKVLNEKQRAVTFTVVSDAVPAADGAKIVPPIMTLRWEGGLMLPEEVAALCLKDERPGPCPGVFPNVWWHDPRERSYLCSDDSHTSCNLTAEEGILSLNLESIGRETRELFVKARGKNSQAVQSTQSIGRVRVDATVPTVAKCGITYPGQRFECAQLAKDHTWLQAAGGRLEVVPTVGESGVKPWICEGPLASGCGRDTVLTVEALPEGESHNMVWVESGVGLRSAPYRVDLKIDATPPDIGKVSIAGHRFEAREPIIVLSGASSFDVQFKVEDEHSGVRNPGAKSGSRCLSNAKLQALLKFEPLLDVDHELTAADCAMPSGNVGLRKLRIIRPLSPPKHVQPLTIQQWKERLGADPSEATTLMSRVSQLSPRFTDGAAVSDQDWPILAAWLNLVSGRRKEGKPKGLMSCTLESQRSSGTTRFSLVRTIDVCGVAAADDAKMQERAMRLLQREGLLGAEGALVTGAFAKPKSSP